MSNLIVQDLCDQQHVFFYLQDDRKPCPYCRIAKLGGAVKMASGKLRYAEVVLTAEEWDMLEVE